jgi:hypothetical protein
MIGFVYFFQQFIDPFVDVDKELLPTGAQDKAGDLIESGGCIIDEKGVFGFVGLSCCRCALGVFPFGCVFLLWGNQVECF